MEGTACSAKGRGKRHDSEQTPEDREAGAFQGAVADPAGSTQGTDEWQSATAWSYAGTDGWLWYGGTILGSSASATTSVWSTTAQFRQTTSEATAARLRPCTTTTSNRRCRKKRATVQRADNTGIERRWARASQSQSCRSLLMDAMRSVDSVQPAPTNLNLDACRPFPRRTFKD